MAAIDPENISTAWAPLVIGLVGVGGVLLPSQVVFSIISPHDLIGTSVSLSIVIRAIGQVIGVSMYYNVFKTRLTTRAADPSTIAFPAIENGLVFTSLDPAALTPNITALVTALAAGPFTAYAHLFPDIDSAVQIAAIQQAAHELYKPIFPLLYLISIAWGGAAVVACFFFWLALVSLLMIGWLLCCNDMCMDSRKVGIRIKGKGKGKGRGKGKGGYG